MARKNLDKVQPIEITEINDVFMCSSLQVAKHFGKAHDNVLRDIRNLIEDAPEEWVSRNFEDTFEIVAVPNNATRQDPAFMLTRDGFAILAMGFTGKRALLWKVKYMEAFNAMEAKLKAQALGADASIHRIGVTPPPREDEDTRSLRMQRAVRGFASYWAFIDNMSVECAERTVCIYLGVQRIEDIRSTEITERAFSFLRRATHQPAGDGRATSPELARIAENLFTACSQFRHTRDLDVKGFYEDFSSSALPPFEALTEQGAKKVIAALWGIFNQVQRHTWDQNRREVVGEEGQEDTESCDKKRVN